LLPIDGSTAASVERYERVVLKQWFAGTRREMTVKKAAGQSQESRKTDDASNFFTHCIVTLLWWIIIGTGCGSVSKP